MSRFLYVYVSVLCFWGRSALICAMIHYCFCSSYLMPSSLPSILPPTLFFHCFFCFISSNSFFFFLFFSFSFHSECELADTVCVCAHSFLDDLERVTALKYLPSDGAYSFLV